MYYKRSTSKGNIGHCYNVRYIGNKKRWKSEKGRLTDFKLGVNLAENDVWRDVGQPQVAAFSILTSSATSTRYLSSHVIKQFTWKTSTCCMMYTVNHKKVAVHL